MALVIFDFDGTLVDTAPAFAAACEEVAVDEGGEAPSVERIRRVVAEESSYSSVARRLVTEMRPAVEGSSGGPRGSSIDRTFRELYPMHAKLYPGVYRLLMALEKQQMNAGVIGSAPPGLLADMLDYFGLDGYIQFSYALEEEDSQVRQVVSGWTAEVSAEEAIWVSSRSTQLEMAGAVGARAVYAAYGYGEGLENSSFDRLNHLSDLITRW